MITIFVNHIPGIAFDRFTHRNYSISDSAELFVFLAGWALALMVARFEARQAKIEALKALADRAVKIYAAHLMLISIAIGMLAASAQAFDNPLLLEWHNAAAVFYDPIRAHIGLVTLTYQLGYFDILPLYVVLTAAAPLVVLLHWFVPALLLPMSIALYLAALVFRVSIPTWPVEGHWFFNPLAWQLVFVLGFVLAQDKGLGAFARRHLRVLRWIAAPIVAAGLAMMVFDVRPDPTLLPEPKMLFVDMKSYQTPIRLCQFLALVAVVSSLNTLILQRAATFAGILSMMGRKSLVVFCVASVLSLAAQIVRFVYQADLLLDTAILIGGVLLLMLSAWLAEWPKKAQSQRPARGGSA